MSAGSRRPADGLLDNESQDVALLVVAPVFAFLLLGLTDSVGERQIKISG